MRIELSGVAKGRKGAILSALDLRVRSGHVTLATAETEQRPTVLGLIASGRMKPDAGAVTLDGARDDWGLRRRVALVDAPDVCDPAPDVSVLGVVSEELMFAGRRTDASLALPLRPLDEMYAEPAQRFVEARGGRIVLNALARLTIDNGRVAGLDVRGEPIAATNVIAAVPWFALEPLLSHIPTIVVVLLNRE